jgi:hypothetical protein
MRDFRGGIRTFDFSEDWSSNLFVILSAAKNPAGETKRFAGAQIQMDSSLRSE